MSPLVSPSSQTNGSGHYANGQSVAQTVIDLYAPVAAPKVVGIPHGGVDEIFKPLPPIPWVCEGLRLAPGGVTVIAGYGFSGKTMFAQSLALSVASGRPVLGIHPCRHGRVLHLDYEQGRRLTDERYQRIAAGMRIGKADLGDRLRRSVFPATYLDAPDVEDVLSATFEGFDVVIIDSFRASAPSTDENSSSARIPLDILARAAEKTGTLVIVIHHARKPNDNAAGGAKMAVRGSSAIFDACATVYVFAGNKDEPTRVLHEKDRHRGTLLPDFGIQVHDEEFNGDPRGALRLEYLDAQAYAAIQEQGAKGDDALKLRDLRSCILTYLGTKPDGFLGNRSDLRTACRGGKHAIFALALRLLEEEGLVAVSTRPTRIRLVLQDLS